MAFLAPLAAPLGLSGSALGGGLLSGLGGFLTNRDTSQQLSRAIGQAQHNPMSVSGDLGSVSATDRGYNLSLSPQQQLLSGLLGTAAMSGLSGGPYAQFANQFTAQGGNALGGAFTDANAALGSLPTGAFDQAQAGLGNLSGLFGGLGQGFLGGAASGLGQMGNAFGMGQGLLSGASQGFANAGNVGGLVDDRLALLRQQAAPQEEQQYNSLQNRLFSQGRLGSTGGSRDIEAFARGLGQADLGRQVEAQNLGLQTSGLLGQLAQAQGGLGANLFGQGFGAAGNLGSLGTGLLGNLPGLTQQQFGNAIDFSNLGASRAQQRMQNAMGLFGFGSDLGSTGFSQGLGAISGLNQLQSPLLGLLSGSISASDTANLAGGRQAGLQSQQQGSGGLFGSILGGLGSIF